MYKTYAAKYSTSKKKIIAKYKKNGVFAIPYTNKRGYEFKREFYDKGFKRKELPNRYLDGQTAKHSCHNRRQKWTNQETSGTCM